MNTYRENMTSKEKRKSHLLDISLQIASAGATRSICPLDHRWRVFHPADPLNLEQNISANESLTSSQATLSPCTFHRNIQQLPMS
jgi:hypothetical protein